MASKVFFDRAEFVSNRYVIILSKNEIPEDFHLIQDFLSISKILYALNNPVKVSTRVVLQVWTTTAYSKGGVSRVPGISFMHNGEMKNITTRVVCEALHLHVLNGYANGFSGDVLRGFMLGLGYDGDMSRMGRLTRPQLRRE